jgi:glycosyltransferase involved in cell wall biosynthesis
MFPPAFLGGGPIRSLEALVRQAPPGFEQLVITSDRDLNADVRLSVESNRWLGWEQAVVRYVSYDSWRRTFSGWASLRARRPDLLYFNSFFDVKSTIIPLWLARIGFWGRASILVAVRGEFGTGALQICGRKKRLYIGLCKMSGVLRGVTWHASSEEEARDIRRTIPRRASVLVRRNDTALPRAARLPGVVNHGPLRVVHLGRLAEIKGLHILLAALSSVARPIHLDIYGTYEDEHYSRLCERLSNDVPAHVVVKFRGSLPHAEAASTLAGYDVLALPTAGENFGHVIAEALSVSCPVMCPDTTPWSAVLRGGAGILVSDRRVQSWTSALDDYAGIAASERLSRRTAAGRGYEAWANAAPTAHLYEQYFTAPRSR